MDRVTVGIIIALAALLMSGVFAHDALADEAGGKPAVAALPTSPAPVASGPCSERVLSLLLTLEALRAAPGLLATSKV